MAGNSSGKRKLQKELLQPRLILADVGIDLCVRALEISVGYDRWPAVSGARDIDHIEIVFLDDAVQMNIDEILPRGCAPMTEQHSLHVSERQRPLQQRIVVKINLSDRKIVRRPPIGIYPVAHLR